MADEYRLAQDEYVISKNDSPVRIDVPSYITDESIAHDLVLTNKRIIIHTSKAKLFKPTIHGYFDIPLTSVKVVDNRVQAKAERNKRSGYVELLIYLTEGGTATFAFDEIMGKTAKTWASLIANVLLGDSSLGIGSGLQETTNSLSAIPYAEDVAKTVSGTIDVFKSAFRRSRQETAPEIVIFCESCGAKTTIRQGQTKYCKFCGSPIVAPPA